MPTDTGRKGRGLAPAVAVLVLPLAVLAVRVIVRQWPNPGGDLALIELRVRDVGSHTPLLGSYGRYGFNQPGPLWFYVLAVPYRLLGSRYAGLQLGVLAVNAAGVWVILAVSRRRGGAVPFLVVVALLAVLVHGLGPRWLVDPWEPHGLTLLCAALLFLAYDAVLGSAPSLIAAAVVATLLAQAQAGLVPFAAAIIGATVMAVVVQAMRHRDGAVIPAQALRPVAVVTAVTAVLWMPPLLAVVLHRSGSLTALLRSMRHPEAATLGVREAWRAVAVELGPGTPWLRSHQPLARFAPIVDVAHVWPIPVGLVALVAAAVAASRRRAPEVAFAAAVGLGLVAAVAALARLLGPLFVWIPEWTRVLGFSCWVAVGWCAYASVRRERRPALDGVAVPVLGVVAIAAIAASVVAGVRSEPIGNPSVDAVHRLARAALTEPGKPPTLVTAATESAQVFGSDPGTPTLVLDLERAGVAVVVAHSQADHYGDHRARPGRARRELRLLTDRDPLPAGFRVVAVADPLTPDQRRERSRLEAAYPELAATVPAPQRLGFRAAHPEVDGAARKLDALPDLPVLRLAERQLG